ncbi:hypothetical protein H311_04492, partial [Anncaliia algerae PRA109]
MNNDIQNKIIEIKIKLQQEVLTQNEILEFLDFLMKFMSMSCKNDLFEHFFLPRINLINQRSSYILEEDILKSISLYLAQLHEINKKIEESLSGKNLIEMVCKMLLCSIESTKFDIASYFKLKLNENFVIVRKQNDQEFLKTCEDFLCDRKFEAKHYMKRILKLDFKGLDLSPKDYTYLSIKSFFPALNLVSSYKRLKKMNV